MAPARDGILFIAANPAVDRTYEVAHLTTGEINRPLVVAARPGGKGLNAARAAVAIGGRVTAVALLGGHAGEWVRDRLATAGVDVVVATTAAETRTCISVLDRSSGRLTEFYERGEAVKAADWDALEAAAGRQLDTGAIGAMTFSGSLPVGAPPDGFARLARLAHAAGVRVLADISGPALVGVLNGGPAVVKINAAEAAEVTGLAVDGPEAALGAAGRLRELGAAEVIVTLGDRGAVGLAADGREVRLGPPAARGRYPVGSGDAFLAGLAMGLVHGGGLEDAMRLGAAAGAANAAIPGIGDLDRDLFERLRGAGG
jgi:1-phosphofructokinase family hexose kinase